MEAPGSAECLGDREGQGGEESDLRGAVLGEVVGGHLRGVTFEPVLEG